MNRSWLSGNVLGAAAVGVVLFGLGLGCAQRSEQVFSEEQVRPRNASVDREGIDPVLLEKVRPLYPNIQLKREGKAAFFSIVREVFRVRIDDATERLIVESRPLLSITHGAHFYYSKMLTTRFRLRKFIAGLWDFTTNLN
ncbi:MAG: hypothetical protein ACYSWZ_02990 [Planctomycetota bacterium]